MYVERGDAFLAEVYFDELYSEVMCLELVYNQTFDGRPRDD